MKPRVIKTEEQYEEALARIEELMDIPQNDPQEEELELLVVLVEKYEEEKYPVSLPDPIEAIKFRKDQAGLTNRDLVPYIGSPSKVSEVLNRKRPLSLTMIRALHEGLGISAEVLLQKPGEELPVSRYTISDYPFAEMFNRGYFSSAYNKLSAAKEQFEECLIDFFSLYNSYQPKVCLRQSDTKFGSHAFLQAWHARVLNIISREEICDYQQEKLNSEFLQDVVRLSYYTHGVLLVKEALNRIGVFFVILKHLPKTYLDGACFYTPKGNPVVVMTLRHDRLDNFWFTLMHELAHIFLGHVSPEGKELIIDDTIKNDETTEIEDEANRFAYQALIPDELWAKHSSKLVNSEKNIIELAEELKISPAILAGRIRWEKQDYTIFTDLVGHGEVRKYLEEKQLSGISG